MYGGSVRAGALRSASLRKRPPKSESKATIRAALPRETTVTLLSSKSLQAAAGCAPIAEGLRHVCSERIDAGLLPGAEGRGHTLKVNLPELAEPERTVPAGERDFSGRAFRGAL